MIKQYFYARKSWKMKPAEAWAWACAVEQIGRY